MSAPVFSYSGMQLNYPVGSPLTISPINTGDSPSPKLRISTVSGNSNNMDYPKDGGPNVATYKFPNSVASKADGSLAMVDDWSQTIRVINPAGVSSTIAGKWELIGPNVQSGYVDGQGSAARFSNPKAVAFDVAGNIVVLDAGNYRIRQVSPTGLVTTLVGSGIKGLADGNATTAQFTLLNSLWIDNQGNIFVTDNYRVRKITPLGIVTTIAGSASKGNTNGQGTAATFKCMRGITGDNAGNLFVSDTDNMSVRKIDSLGNVTTLATGIAATGISYYNGILYIADWMSNQIKTITLSGVVNVYAGSGLGEFRDGFDTRTGRTAAGLYNPEGLAIDGSGANLVVYIADKSSMKIRKTDYANYTINKPLPAGLNFDAMTGVISGIPTQTTELTIYNITAGNNSGYTTVIIGFKTN